MSKRMLGKTGLFLFPILLLTIFVPFCARAYEIDTHAYLTKEAISFYTSHTPESKMPEGVERYLIDGSRREDDAPRWMNHFYDPVNNRGLTYDPAIDPTVYTGAWAASKNWATDSENQNKLTYKVPATVASILSAVERQKISDITTETDFTWSKAKRYYLNGEYEKAFFALGHVVHLIEDTSVPDHTRNDPHPGDSPYEEFTNQYTLANQDSGLNSRLQDKNLPALSSLGDYFDGLATYSNNNFYSKDTIGIQSGYQNPVPEFIEREGSYYYGFKKGDDGNLYKIFVLEKEPKSLLIESKEKISLDIVGSNHSVLNDYWSRLSTKAVEYSAGVIDLFFREVQKDKENGVVVEKPKSLWATLVGFVDTGASGLAQVIRGVFVSGANGDASQNGAAGDALPHAEGNGNRTNEANVSAQEQSVSDGGDKEAGAGDTAVNGGASTPLAGPDIQVLGTLETGGENSAEHGVLKTDESVNATSSASSLAASEERTSSTNSVSGNAAQSAGDGATSTAPLPRFYDVRINEIMYDAPGSDTGREWIEVLNYEWQEVDICGWKVFENKTNHTLTLARGACAVAPGGYAIIARDVNGFFETYPSFRGTVFTGSFSLNNTGETIALKNGDREIDAVAYVSDAGARGDGNSLQKASDRWYARAPTPGSENREVGGSGGGTSSASSANNTNNANSTSTSDAANKPPVANFSFSPLTPQEGDAVNFDGSLSSDADGAITGYVWDFGDGAAASGTESAATHIYASAGDFSVRLTVEDNKGATAEKIAAVSVAPLATATSTPADHIVISEVLFDAAGSDTGKEFVELYNPTDTPLRIDTWALRYSLGAATSTSALAVLDASSSADRVDVLGKGFLLIGFSSYDPANFSGRAADAVRSRGLPNGTDTVHIDLYDESGNVVDNVTYASTSISEAGHSIERKAIQEGVCVAPQGAGEFEGHLCDRGLQSDFTERATPNPQSSENLIEPRGTLAAPAPIGDATSAVSFEKASMALRFAWHAATSSDPRAIVSYRITDVSTSGTPLAEVVTTSTEAQVAIQEVGRTHSFAMQASDQDGLVSAAGSHAVSAPSFLTRASLYADPRGNAQGRYAIDMYYDALPFIPDLFGRNAWQGMAFYLNRAPSASSSMLATAGGYAPDDTENVLGVVYPSCGTNIEGTSVPSVIFPLASEWCGPGGGLQSSSLNFARLEDNHLLLRSASTTAETALGQGDYFTVAYYALKDTGGDRQDLALVALDETHYPFELAPPAQSSPEMGTIATSYDALTAKLTVSWPRASDADSIDTELVYELNFTRAADASSTLDKGLWTASTTALVFEKTVVPNDAYLIGARARDDFGNISSATTTFWSAPAAAFPIEQTTETGWSDEWGTVLHTSVEPDTASFQSFALRNDAVFDTVIVKVRQKMVSDVTTLHLAAYADTGSGKPDFGNLLGEATLPNMLNPDGAQEQTFTFASPIAIVASSTYWLVLDVAGYSDPTGYSRNAWQNAIAAGGEAYANGVAGTGHARGANAACTSACAYERPYVSVGPADWYFRLGRSE